MTVSESDRLDHFCAAAGACLQEVWEQLGFEGQPTFFVMLSHVSEEVPGRACFRVFGNIPMDVLPEALRATAKELETGRGRPLDLEPDPGVN